MSKRAKLRIVQDFVNFNKNKPEGIYLYINENDVFNNYALIIGPENTPYYGGYYFFKIKFPYNYPEKPPDIQMLTLNKDVRFNPNLYECGKVCLSILGTWAGPGWKKVMNITSTLLSVRSLLNEFPIVNEPGFENTKQDDENSINYNHYLIFYNYKVAIIDILNNLNKEEHVKVFKKNIIDEFKKNFKNLSDNLKSYQIILGEKIVKKNTMYFIRKDHHLDFIELDENFNKLINNNLKNLL